MSMEDALEGAKAYYLEDGNLEDALAAIELARSVTIPRWKDLDTGFVLTKQFPNISIVPATTAHSYGDNDDFLDPWFDHAVAVLISHAGSVKKDVQYDCIRYVEAISNLSIGTRTKYQYNDRFDTVQLDDVTYSIEEATEEKVFTQITVMEILIRELRT